MALLRSVMLLPLALGVLAAACSNKAEQAPTGLASEAVPTPTVDASSQAPSAAAGVARHEKLSNAEFEFDYSYPAAAGAIPALKALLDADIAKQKAALAASAKEQRAESKKEGFDYNPLGNWVEWKVVTDLPGWLSLSADISDYQGGAHPNHGFDALLWDRQANQRRSPLDLFTSKEALSRAIRRDFCFALDRERGKRRGEPVKPGGTDEFDQCIDPAASTVILGSSNHQAFDRIGVLVAPYEAGPYAEGDYEVTLPVTGAVLAAVRPEFRLAFAVKR